MAGRKIPGAGGIEKIPSGASGASWRRQPSDWENEEALALGNGRQAGGTEGWVCTGPTGPSETLC